MTLELDLDRDFDRHRTAILAMLRSEFGSLLNEYEREDLCQVAWLALLEETHRGGEIRNVAGFLKTVAWRRARDRVRNASAELVDPIEGPLAGAPDDGRSPDEEVESRIDAARCRALVETLRPDERAIVTLRFGWELKPKEIQQLLGIRRPRYNKLVRRAMDRIAEAAEVDWSESHRELLVACEAGTATPEERERAARLVKDDPACRALLAEIRGWSRSAAALLPFPILFDLEYSIGHSVVAAVWRTGDRVAAWTGGKANAVAQMAAGRPPGTTLATVASIAMGGAGFVVAIEAERAERKVERKPAVAETQTVATAPVRASSKISRPPRREAARRRTKRPGNAKATSAPAEPAGIPQRVDPGAASTSAPRPGSTRPPERSASAPSGRSAGGERAAPPAREHEFSFER